jgi:hypothetical protein
MHRFIAGWRRDWWLAQSVVRSTVFDVNLRRGLWWVLMRRSILFPVIRLAAVVNHSGSGLAASSQWIVGWELAERKLVVHSIIQCITAANLWITKKSSNIGSGKKGDQSLIAEFTLWYFPKG